MSIRLSNGSEIPVEMHKIRIVQKNPLAPARERLQAMEEAGYNTFLLRTRDIFLDMLTDSGTNAMTDNQQAAMLQSDDAYAGSESFYKLADSVKEIFGYEYLLPVHQGRAGRTPARQDVHQTRQLCTDELPLHHHKGTFQSGGGTVLELFGPEALNTQSSAPFKGNMDLGRLKEAIEKHGVENVPFVRMEATTNLIGGQPFSLANLHEVKDLITPLGIPLVVDASLISETPISSASASPNMPTPLLRRSSARLWS